MPVWFEWSIWCWLRTLVSETYTTWLMLDNAMGANFFVLLLTRFSTAKKKDEGDVSAMGLHEISLWGVSPDLPMIVWLVFTVFYLMHGHMYRVLCKAGGGAHWGTRTSASTASSGGTLKPRHHQLSRPVATRWCGGAMR